MREDEEEDEEQQQQQKSWDGMLLSGQGVECMAGLEPAFVGLGRIAIALVGHFDSRTCRATT